MKGKKYWYALLLLVMCTLSACKKEDDVVAEKKPTGITTVEQAESVARCLWQMVSRLNDIIDTGYEYTNKTFTENYFGEFSVWGKKYNSGDCTVSELQYCWLKDVSYMGYTFSGALQYYEKNYHYNKNYKRICEVWSGYDENSDLEYGVAIKSESDNIEDFIYFSGKKDNYIDKKYNCDRTPAVFTIVNSQGEAFEVLIR